MKWAGKELSADRQKILKKGISRSTAVHDLIDSVNALTEPFEGHTRLWQAWI
jgi:hypothetical protein